MLLLHPTIYDTFFFFLMILFLYDTLMYIFYCNALKPTIHHVQEHGCGKGKEKLGILSLLPQGKICPKNGGSIFVNRFGRACERI